MADRQNKFTRAALRLDDKLETMRDEAAKGGGPDIGEEAVSVSVLRRRFKEGGSAFRKRYAAAHGIEATLTMLRGKRNA